MKPNVIKIVKGIAQVATFAAPLIVDYFASKELKAEIAKEASKAVAKALNKR